jgi:hypothetical protein
MVTIEDMALEPDRGRQPFGRAGFASLPARHDPEGEVMVSSRIRAKQPVEKAGVGCEKILRLVVWRRCEATLA